MNIHEWISSEFHMISLVTKEWFIYLVAMYMCARMLSCVWLFVTPWTVVHQVPLPMEFPKQAYWSRLPFPPSGDLPDPGIEPMSLASPAFGKWTLNHSATWETLATINHSKEDETF